MVTTEQQTVQSALPTVLRAAVNQLAGAIAQHKNLCGMLTQAQSDREKVDGIYQEVFRQLSEVEASVVVDGGAGDPALRKKVTEKQQAVLICDARIAGLKARVQAARTDIDVAMRALGSVEDAWRRETVAGAIAEYQAAVNAFVGAVLRPVAIGLALTDSRLSNIARQAELFDIDDVSKNALKPLRRWRENEVMSEHVQGFAAIHAAAVAAIGDARSALAVSV